MTRFILPVLLSFSSSVAFGSGYYESLSIDPIAQEENYYCGPAIVETWVTWFEGDSPSQDDIADDWGVTTSDGMNVNEVKEAMEDYSSPYFSKYTSSSSSTFGSKIVSEIHGSSGMAVMAKTRRRDGTSDSCQHWLLVDSYWTSATSYTSSYTSLNGYYMDDPLYASAFTGTYYYINPDTYVTKSTFFSSYVSKCPGTSYYYGVED